MNLFHHKQIPGQGDHQQELEASAKLLLRRDFELLNQNDRSDKLISELTTLHQIVLIANQSRDRRQMFEQVGQLLISHLGYDAYFVIENVAGNFRPFVALGFEDRPFESKFDVLQSSHSLAKLFSQQPFWLLQPSQDQFTNQVISILNLNSVAIVQVRTKRFQALLGVGINHALDTVSNSDINFLMLLASQLNVIIDNIDQFNDFAYQNGELARRDQAKTTFLSIASHQLRTPLSVMRYALSFLSKPTTGALNPKQQSMVTEMNKNTVRLINLVNNLLSITRLEQGRLNFNPQPVALSQLVEALLAEIASEVASKQIQVVVDIPPILSVPADPTLLREAIMNLITNGLKYNTPGGKLTISAKQIDATVSISVTDTGIGMNQEEQAHVFTQFFRSAKAQSIDPQGVGLGLYTTRQFIQMHGGDVTLMSVPDKGTTFTITLPAQQPAAKT